ncbi:hypothetical protein QYF36_020968 [Acer negundo]|nr:hypothetical protein QYF36_020968 [Acer negundo]
MLVDDRGRKFTNEKGIFDTVCSYFDDLFSSSSPSTKEFRQCSELMESRLNFDMYLALEGCFVADEGLISRFKGLGSREVLRGLAIELKHAALEAICLVFWSIWLDRNGIVHNGVARSAGILVDDIFAFLKDF